MNVSTRAVVRGMTHLGTLGSGNHFIEIQVVDEIYDAAAAEAMGLHMGEVLVMIHTGAVGLGYQVAQDYIKSDGTVAYNSDEGRRYLSAMAAAANFAYANRQIITHFVREAFQEVFGHQAVELVWDAGHNLMKVEDGLLVHRKGASPALGPSAPRLPPRYRGVGQPIPVGGSMGRQSYILAGLDDRRAFGSTCHGSGRNAARTTASARLSAERVAGHLRAHEIDFVCGGRSTLIEESCECYKDIDEVVRVCEVNRLSRRVARVAPLAVIKG